MWFERIRRQPLLTYQQAYLLVSLLIMAPLLTRGFVLTLDMVFAPTIRAVPFSSSSYLFYGLLHVLNLVVPADILQKLLLLAIFTLAGWGMHRLSGVLGADGRLGGYAAGLLYQVNPFTYDRLMAGQYAVLAGYALLPWVAAAGLTLVRRPRPSWRDGAVLGGWLAVLGVLSIHSLGPALIVLLMVVGGQAWRWRRLRQVGRLRPLLVALAAGVGVWLVASLNWLVPLLAGRSATASAINSFTAMDRQAFATDGVSAIERVGNVLGLQGFWAERHALFTLPQDIMPGWVLVVLVMLGLVGFGLVVAWRQRPAIGLLLSSCIVCGVVLASGVSSGWLAAHLPLFAGYREPQKFAMLVALGYGGALAFAVNHLTRPRLAGLPGLSVFGGVALALPFLLAPTLLWGANRQLQASHYPDSWYAAKQYLDGQRAGGQPVDAIFLPWHLYLYLGFAGRVVANPAPVFFDTPVAVSDNLELEGAAPAKPTPLKRAVARALPHAAASHMVLGQTLAANHIHYVLLAKDNDYQNYAYLDRQANITLQHDYGTLLLYKVVSDKDTSTLGASRE